MRKPDVSGKPSLMCLILGHRQEVIYTDDDECLRCGALWYWPAPEDVRIAK